MHSSACRVAECLLTAWNCYLLAKTWAAISFSFLYTFFFLLSFYFFLTVLRLLSEQFSFQVPRLSHSFSFVGLHFCNNLESHLVGVCGLAGTPPRPGPGNFDL